MPKNKWEFPQGRQSTIPYNLMNTGDVDVIREYLDESGSTLSKDDTDYLNNVMETTGLVSNYHDQAMQRLDNGSPVGTEPIVRAFGQQGVIIDDIHQNSFQTSNTGCWSCFLSNALLARGITLSQEQIRSYRPRLSRKDAGYVGNSTSEDMNTDSLSNAYESGDLVTEVLPNSMLKEIEIHPFTNEMNKGIDQQQYINNSVDFLKSKIRDTITNVKAPVGMLINGHYRTIVGIEGDDVIFKDSYEYKNQKGKVTPDTNYRASISSLVSTALSDGGLGVKLNFIEDVKLSKDGKTLLNVPSAYVSMESNGDLVLPPDKIQEAANGEMNERNQFGVNIRRFGGREGDMFENTWVFDGFTTYGIAMTERTYLPKKLHAENLRELASQRSEAEENELKTKHQKELNDVAEKKVLTEEEQIRIEQLRFNYEEDQKEMVEAQVKKQAETQKAQQKTEQKPVTEPQKTEAKPEKKPTATQTVKQEPPKAAAEPQKNEPKAEKKPTVTQTVKSESPKATTEPVKPTTQAVKPEPSKAVTEPAKPKTQTAKPVTPQNVVPITSRQTPTQSNTVRPAQTQTINSQQSNSRATTAHATNSYGMQEDFRSIGKRYKAELTKIQGLKSDLSDMKEVTGALESLANVTGGESPRQFMDLTHKLNVALVNYQTNNPVKFQVVNNLSELNLSCTKDLLKAKQTTANMEQEKAAEYAKFSSRYNNALDSIKNSGDKSVQDIRAALEPMTKLTGKEDIRTINDMTFKLNQALLRYNGNDPAIAKLTTDTMNMNAELSEKSLSFRRQSALKKTNITELQDKLMGSAKQTTKRHTSVTPQKTASLTFSK